MVMLLVLNAKTALGLNPVNVIEPFYCRTRFLIVTLLAVILTVSFD